MNNPSKQQLSRNGERRIKSLMVRILNKFETSYPNIQHVRDAAVFKGDVKTMCNDVIRAYRDELNDYKIDYRPLRVTNEDRLAMTRTFLDTVQRVTFGFTSETNKPFVKIYASKDNLDVLRGVRSEFSVGVIYTEDSSVILAIVGLEDCVNCVLPIMDRYNLHSTVQEGYKNWRQEVVNSYKD
jgi:hypothetical protein